MVCNGSKNGVQEVPREMKPFEGRRSQPQKWFALQISYGVRGMICRRVLRLLHMHFWYSVPRPLN